MTVQNTPNFIDYAGDDVTTVFPFTFRVDDIAWLSVDFLDDFDQFNLNADQDASPGGNATYLVAPPSPGMGGPDPTFRILRTTSQVQDLNYTRYDAFDAESTEDALDKLTMITQDMTSVAVSNTLLLTTGISPGHQHVLADITDYVPPLGTVPGGTITGQMMIWDNGLPAWVLTPYLMPVADGTVGQVLTTDGAGNVSFAAAGGGGWADGESGHFLTDLLLTSSLPSLEFFEIGGPVDEKGWRLFADSGDFWFRTYNDADDAEDNIFRVSRTGNVIDTLDFLCPLNGFDQEFQRIVFRDIAYNLDIQTTVGTSQSLQYLFGPCFDVDFVNTTGSPVLVNINGGPPAGRYGQVVVRIKQHAASVRTITWSFDTFRFQGGVQHPLTSILGGYSVYTLETFDAGASWEVTGEDYS